MNRTDRLHALLDALRRAGAAGRTSEQLARRFEVSPRTEKRPVDPICLGVDDGAWYLFGWCHRRAAGRTFRVDRIAAAFPTAVPAGAWDFEEVFGRPPPEDARPVL